MKIIELKDHDAYRLLWLVQGYATSNIIWDDYWADMAKQIKRCLDAQGHGKFFQCSACTEGCIDREYVDPA